MTAAPVSWWCARDDGDDPPPVEETVARPLTPPWAHAEGVRRRIEAFRAMQGQAVPATPPISDEEPVGSTTVGDAVLEVALLRRRNTILATARIVGRAVFSGGDARRAARLLDSLADRIDAERAQLRSKRGAI